MESAMFKKSDRHVQENEEVAVLDEADAVSVGRPTTDANVFFQLGFGVVATIVLALAVSVFRNSESSSLKYINDIINERGWVQYGELLMSFMVVALMVLKSRIVKNQLKVVASNPIPADLDLTNDEELHRLRDSIMRREEFSWSIILNRIDRAIGLWLSTKDVGRVATWASAESARDSSSSDSSYSLCRVLIWAIPILGFIGTVLGLAVAVSGFGVLGGSAEIGAIKEAIGQVTLGLGVAFDTTLLALMLTVLLMFPLSFIQRSEEIFFVDLENYLDDMFVSRLPSGDKQSIVIENLEDSIEAAFRRYIPDPDRYDEVFTRSIEKAATSVEAKFAGLTKGYESALKQVATQMSSEMAGVMDGVSKSAQGVVDGYQKSAGELQAATEVSIKKSIDAAQVLAGKLDEVSKLAAGVQELLQVDKAVQKSLAGIAASDDFQKTLADLRAHISTTTEFCTRLSQPRVITLHEEVA
jgi:biopolymer transport protein ExbB/TolQ